MRDFPTTAEAHHLSHIRCAIRPPISSGERGARHPTLHELDGGLDPHLKLVGGPVDEHGEPTAMDDARILAIWCGA